MMPGSAPRPAAMFEPAHDGLVLVQYLHAIDAEIVIVLARVAGSLGHHQRPGDQGCGLARPACLNRELAEIDIIAAPEDLLAGGMRLGFGVHRQHGLDQRQQRRGLAQGSVSVISRKGETGPFTRTSSPTASSRAMKSRRDR